MNDSKIMVINRELKQELSDPAVGRALLATTFKGLSEGSMKQSIMEGMMRGFTFKNFLEKDVYATPYGGGYSLVTSIAYTRKIAARSGLAGKSAPTYTYDEKGKVESCTVTIKKRDGTRYIGDYTATVFFVEFNTGKNNWAKMPRVMIAKVAEMHALRMAFPEELSQQYIEEEMEMTAAEPKIKAAESMVEGSNLQMGKFAKTNEKNETKKTEDVEDTIEYPDYTAEEGGTD